MGKGFPNPFLSIRAAWITITLHKKIDPNDSRRRQYKIEITLQLTNLFLNVYKYMRSDTENSSPFFFKNNNMVLQIYKI